MYNDELSTAWDAGPTSKQHWGKVRVSWIAVLVVPFLFQKKVVRECKIGMNLIQIVQIVQI